MGKNENTIVMMQKHLLKTIVRNKKLHARFLNTLSLMELCGAKKVSRLMAPADCSSFLLEHAAEEYRHAYYLRKLANKVGSETIETYTKENTLAWPHSSLYIKHLDQRICLQLRSCKLADSNLIKKRAYILTTLAIELRALSFYRNYQVALDEENIEFSVKSILSEEESHLFHIKKLAADDPDLEPAILPCMAIEENLYSTWIGALRYHVGLANTEAKWNNSAVNAAQLEI